MNLPHLRSLHFAQFHSCSILSLPHSLLFPAKITGKIECHHRANESFSPALLRPIVPRFGIDLPHSHQTISWPSELSIGIEGDQLPWLELLETVAHDLYSHATPLLITGPAKLGVTDLFIPKLVRSRNLRRITLSILSSYIGTEAQRRCSLTPLARNADSRIALAERSRYLQR